MKVIKLMEYSQYLRHNYLDAFNQLPWEEFIKDRAASFGSLRDILLHCIEIMDRLINLTILGKAETPKINFSDYDSMDKVNAYLHRVEAEMDQYLRKVTPEELSRVVTRKFFDGTTVQMTVEDVLVDYFQEETHHRGEFIAILWQMKIEPPHLGLGRYLKINP